MILTQEEMDRNRIIGMQRSITRLSEKAELDEKLLEYFDLEVELAVPGHMNIRLLNAYRDLWYNAAQKPNSLTPEDKRDFFDGYQALQNAYWIRD